MEKSCAGGQCHGREDFDAAVSMRDLVDSYLPPFQACVERGKAAGLMCSCATATQQLAVHAHCNCHCRCRATDDCVNADNAVNGFPTCAWPWLLNKTARADWGFDGYITGISH